MRIAQIAPLYESVPPKLYGGTERVVAHLCDALTDLGHDVTLFAAEAKTRARFAPMRDQAIRLDPAPLKSDIAAHLTMLHEVKRRSSQFDILHFHLDLLHFPMFEQQAHKTVTTVHGRLDLKDLPTAYQHWPAFGLVSISDAQRRPLPDASWLATVAHGLPSTLFGFHGARHNGGYLAFLGRISPEKCPDLAIELAQRARIPLKIAAKIDPVDAPYFESRVKPLLDEDLIEFIGEIDEERKGSFLGEALALLFPLSWPEPFGLVMIEALACGTPVIAWNRGSVPEVIEDGVTGFIVDSRSEALEAISRLGELDRRAVRAAFERRFSATTMARGYLDVYRQVLDSASLCRAS
jgi:glycosyltransferase involved in cell wall biosynthesis